MDSTNTPVEGTGYSVADAAKNISGLLDSDTGTTEIVDADESEADQASDTDVEEVETEYAEDSEEEQSDEGVEGADTDEGEAGETETAPQNSFKDDELVTIDGEKISFADLKKQRMLHADYTRKRQQETADLKQHMATYQLQQMGQDEMRTVVRNDLVTFKKTIAAMIDPIAFEPPSQELYDTDPYEYGRRKMEYERKQDAVKQLMQAEQLANEQIAKREHEAFVLDQANMRDEMAKRYTEFGDQDKAPVLYTAMGELLFDRGFSVEQINGITDPNILDLVYDYYKLKLGQKQAEKVRTHFESKPKMASPGTAKPKTQAAQSDSHKKDVQKAKRTGTLNDAAKALSKLL